MAQLAFKQAKFYFGIQNDRAERRMGPSWSVTSFKEVKHRVFNRWRKSWHSLQLYSSFCTVGSKISPIWMPIVTWRKAQIKIFFAIFIKTLSRFQIWKKSTSDIYTLKISKINNVTFFFIIQNWWPFVPSNQTEIFSWDFFRFPQTEQLKANQSFRV